jgi:hypothetical protein
LRPSRCQFCVDLTSSNQKLCAALRHVNRVVGQPDTLEREAFDVFLTGDKNMPHQQPLAGRPFAVLILSAINWPVIRPHVDKIAAAIAAAESGSVTMIECGVFLPRSKSESD